MTALFTLIKEEQCKIQKMMFYMHQLSGLIIAKAIPSIRFHKSTDGIAKITINRPEVRNAFRPQTVKEMIHAFSNAR